jgi:hypothetical protein
LKTATITNGSHQRSDKSNAPVNSPGFIGFNEPLNVEFVLDNATKPIFAAFLDDFGQGAVVGLWWLWFPIFSSHFGAVLGGGLQTVVVEMEIVSN